MASQWDTVAIVGVGLIGGSIGQALRGRNLARRVVGIGRRVESLRIAEQNGAVTEVSTDLETSVARADLTVICSPVETIPGLVRRVAASCPPTSVITDAGSTKTTIVQRVDADAVAGQAAFVGSHPLAGSEKTGVSSARPDLLEGRIVVITPTDETPADAQSRVSEFWTALGANVVSLSPTDHDEAVAVTSHLTHLVASALAAATPNGLLPFVATGWLDTTRVAAGDVQMWAQILRQNRDCVLRSLQQFEKVLNSFEVALKQQDDDAVMELLSEGKQRRDAVAD